MTVIMPRVAALRLIDAAVLEADLQASVCDQLTKLGWSYHHETDSRRSESGLPDLICWKGEAVVGKAAVFAPPPIRIPGRVLFVELKRQKGKLRPPRTDAKGKYHRGQMETLNELAASGAETAIWRPSHDREGIVSAVLMGQRTDHRTSAEYADWTLRRELR